MKSPRRRLLRTSLVLLPLSLACARASTSEPKDDSEPRSDAGSGGTKSSTSSGGRSSSTGGTGGTGGSEGKPVSKGTGADAIGVMGGASPGSEDATGGTQSSTEKMTYEGACEGEADLLTERSSVGYKGYAVFTCKIVQDKCTAELLYEPALFQCTDTHVPNCQAQEPTGSNAWTLLGLCSDLGVGGQGGALF